MKKNLFLLIPALALVFFLSSCSKDDTSTTTSTPEGTWAGTGQYGTTAAECDYFVSQALFNILIPASLF